MRKIKVIATTVYFILALVTFSAVGCSQNRKQALINQGNEIAAKVEDYKTKKGKTPDSLTHIGVEEKLEVPIFY